VALTGFCPCDRAELKSSARTHVAPQKTSTDRSDGKDADSMFQRMQARLDGTN
jgi:hypothetical protein